MLFGEKQLRSDQSPLYNGGTARFSRTDKGVTQSDYLQRCDELPLSQRQLSRFAPAIHCPTILVSLQYMQYFFSNLELLRIVRWIENKRSQSIQNIITFVLNS